MKGRAIRTLEDRWAAFCEKFDVLDDGCWRWNAAVAGGGYGAFRGHDGRMTPAHRFAYEFLVGPIPVGLDLDHLCRNRACVNPGHLEPVTRSVNLRRGIGPAMKRATRQETCRRGHAWTVESTFIKPTGARTCRICMRERDARYARLRRARAKAAA